MHYDVTRPKLTQVPELVQLFCQTAPEIKVKPSVYSIERRAELMGAFNRWLEQGCIWIVEIARDVLGMLIVPNGVEVMYVITKVGMRKKGIGEALLNYVKGLPEHEFLTAVAHTTGGERLLTKCGFVATGDYKEVSEPEFAEYPIFEWERLNAES